MFVCCECCVLSGRGLCDGLITRPEESYRLWCVVVQTSSMRRPWPALGRSATGDKEREERDTYVYYGRIGSRKPLFQDHKINTWITQCAVWYCSQNLECTFLKISCSDPRQFNRGNTWRGFANS